MTIYAYFRKLVKSTSVGLILRNIPVFSVSVILSYRPH